MVRWGNRVRGWCGWLARKEIEKTTRMDLEEVSVL